MQFSINDNAIGELLSGICAVSALIGLGAFLMLLLGRMGKRFPFTRLALALALAPLCLVHFVDDGSTSIVNLYAMIVILLGITIDGIGHLLSSRAKTEPVEIKKAEPVAKEERKPGLVVWEKAE